MSDDQQTTASSAWSNPTPTISDNLVDRLRHVASANTEASLCHSSLLTGAAAEIEALREAVRIFTGDSPGWPQVTRGSAVDAAIIRALGPEHCGCVLGCVNERPHQWPTECTPCPVCSGSGGQA